MAPDLPARKRVTTRVQSRRSTPSRSTKYSIHTHRFPGPQPSGAPNFKAESEGLGPNATRGKLAKYGCIPAAGRQHHLRAYSRLARPLSRDARGASVPRLMQCASPPHAPFESSPSPVQGILPVGGRTARHTEASSSPGTGQSSRSLPFLSHRHVRCRLSTRTRTESISGGSSYRHHSTLPGPPRWRWRRRRCGALGCSLPLGNAAS